MSQGRGQWSYDTRDKPQVFLAVAEPTVVLAVLAEPAGECSAIQKLHHDDGKPIRNAYVVDGGYGWGINFF